LIAPFLPVSLGHPESEWRLLPSLRTCFFGGTGKIAARRVCERFAMLPGEPKPEGRAAARSRTGVGAGRRVFARASAKRNGKKRREREDGRPLAASGLTRPGQERNSGWTDNCGVISIVTGIPDNEGAGWWQLNTEWRGIIMPGDSSEKHGAGGTKAAFWLVCGPEFENAGGQ